MILYSISFVICTYWENINCTTNLLNDPILCKFTFLLNDASMSIHTIIIIYLYTFKKVNLKKIFFFLVYVLLQKYNYQNSFEFFVYTKANNNSLINGILLIHPIFLYVSVCIVLYLYISTYEKNFVFFKRLNTFKKKFLFYSLTSLYLGCYWAQQETNWGGWWNWDPIELLSLCLTMVAVLVIHLTTNDFYFFKKKNFFLVGTVLTMYFTSRYDLLNSIHSFSVVSKSSSYLEIKSTAILAIFVYSAFHTNVPKIELNVVNYFSYMIVYIYLISSLLVSVFFQIEISTMIKNYLIATIFVYFLYDKIKIIFFLSILPYYLIFYNNIIINVKKQLKTRVFLIHLLLFIVLIGFISESKSDLFFRSFDNVKKQSYMYSLDKSWFNINVVSNCNYNFKNKLEKHTHLPNFFENFFRFFSQSIKTNFFFNKNTINTNSILFLFQKNLFLYSIIIIFILNKFIFFYEHFKKKVV